MLVEEALPQFRLGELLLEKGVVNQQQLAEALSYQRSSQMALGNVLITLGLLSERQLKSCLRRQRWVRLVAGVVISMVPATACHALDVGNKRVTGADNYFTKAQSRLNNEDAVYSVGIRYAFNDTTGMSLAIQPVQSFAESRDWQPEVSLYRLQHLMQPEPSRYYSHIGFSQNEHNRYTAASPLLYRLTLKGYSLFASSANQSQYFNFERLKGDPARDYQLMFSVTKRFN